MIPYLGEGVVLVLGAVLGRYAPSAGLGLVLVSVPLRVPVFPEVHVATLLLVGLSAARAPEIAKVLVEEKLFLAATLAFPLWVLASLFWARQPMFVWGLLGKWLVVVFAAWAAAADRTRDARAVAAAVLLAVVPHAVWALLERLHLVRPQGDPDLLRFRTIVFEGRVRGRALFYHPNRLGEFAEQLALVLAGAGLSGVWPAVCLPAVALTFAGVWGTGSTGAMAGLGGGLVLLAAWILMSRREISKGLRRSLGVGGLAILAAAAVGLWAFWSHGGLGIRAHVYRFAVRTIEQNPVLGSGAGNWSLLVGKQGPEMSPLWFGGHAHSLLLHVGAELGVIGMVLVTFFFVGPIWAGLRRVARAPMSWRGIGLGAAFGAAALFGHNFVHYFLRDAADGIVTGLVLGMVVGVARRAPPS